MKEVEWFGVNNVEHMWEQVKRAMVESARSIQLSKSLGKKFSVCGGTTRLKLQLRERRMLGRGCWLLVMRKKMMYGSVKREEEG